LLTHVAAVGSKYVDQVLDSVCVLECSMRHLFLRAEIDKNGRMTAAIVNAARINHRAWPTLGYDQDRPST
jgi:hypothetical protein